MFLCHGVMDRILGDQFRVQFSKSNSFPLFRISATQCRTFVACVEASTFGQKIKILKMPDFGCICVVSTEVRTASLRRIQHLRKSSAGDASETGTRIVHGKN